MTSSGYHLAPIILSFPFTLCVPSRKEYSMTRRNFNWAQGIGLAATVFAVSVLVITAGPQWTSVPAYATDRGDERKDARGTRQTGRDEAREQKAACKAGDEKSRAECRRDKRDTKQDARGDARDIKR